MTLYGVVRPLVCLGCRVEKLSRRSSQTNNVDQVLDAQVTGLFEVYSVNERRELRRDGWLLDDDEDTGDGLARLKQSATERAEEQE